MLLALASAVAPTIAQESAKPVPTPNAAEAKFVAQIQADLNKRFPTTAAAERAGYIRFTDEDSTGSISYANRQWDSKDPAHPSQLWYDAKGRLIGADYSVLRTSSSDSAPHLWGIDPSRWGTFRAHIHYGLWGPNGTVKYGGMSVAKYQAAGGDPQHPDAAGLVKAGVAKSANDVRFTFEFPAIWDLQVWVLPNPNGAFAERNPNVTPSSSAKGMSM
ncbi:MAG: hypothetical protein JO043_03295 [Candidatus Eremiobacteraeota bacterium]|nr:hypothetical protein [Candidatus Eremiobacteraeota bacterium]